MGTLIAQTILDRAWIKALDRGVTKRYGTAEALLYLNDAQRDIVTLRHEANAVTTEVTPTNAARLTLAGLGRTRGVAIMDVLRNQNGATPGRAISKKAREWFDVARPSWTTETGEYARHWMDDPHDPTGFFLWPIPTAWNVVIQAAEAPADLSALTDPIGLADSYAKAMEFFLLRELFTKDTTANRNPQLAAVFDAQYRAALGLRDQRDQVTAQKADAKTVGG